jgi:hypothetical protein
MKLKRFDMNSISNNKNGNKRDNVIVVIGKNQTGKSVLVRDFLYHNQDIPIGTIISGKEDATEFYEKIVSESFIHNEYSSYLIEKFLQRQRMVMRQYDKERFKYNNNGFYYQEPTINPRSFVVLEDFFNENLWENKILRRLFINSRCFRITLLITLYNPLRLPPGLKSNIDYIFILREQLRDNNYRKGIYNNYADIFPTFESFCQTMDKYTENYGCLVIDNNTRVEATLDEKVFWYKADFDDYNFKPVMK